MAAATLTGAVTLLVACGSSHDASKVEASFQRYLDSPLAFVRNGVKGAKVSDVGCEGPSFKHGGNELWDCGVDVAGDLQTWAVAVDDSGDVVDATCERYC